MKGIYLRVQGFGVLGFWVSPWSQHKSKAQIVGFSRHQLLSSCCFPRPRHPTTIVTLNPETLKISILSIAI